MQSLNGYIYKERRATAIEALAHHDDATTSLEADAWLYCRRISSERREVRIAFPFDTREVLQLFFTGSAPQALRFLGPGLPEVNRRE
jgi:hypothetical protein